MDSGDETNDDDNKLKLDNFEFFVITNVNDDTERNDIDGVIGLGAPLKSSDSDEPTTTLI